MIYCDWKEGIFINQHITGGIIKRLRESKGLTQEELAAKIHVTGKAISKWETGQGFPDVALLESIAKALNISIIELFSGESVVNLNRSSNLLNSVLYICPVCGNGILSFGQVVISCCGVTLSPLKSVETDQAHEISIENDDGEYYVSVNHPMVKDHYITCLAAVSDNGIQFVKLYPEGNAEARFRPDRIRWIYAYCSQHGLFRIDIKRRRK